MIARERDILFIIILNILIFNLKNFNLSQFHEGSSISTSLRILVCQMCVTPDNLGFYKKDKSFEDLGSCIEINIFAQNAFEIACR